MELVPSLTVSVPLALVPVVFCVHDKVLPPEL